MATHSSILVWKIPGQRSLVGYSHGITKSQTRPHRHRDETNHSFFPSFIKVDFLKQVEDSMKENLFFPTHCMACSTVFPLVKQLIIIFIWASSQLFFFLSFFFFLFVVNFVIHWNEKALGSHVFPSWSPLPPPSPPAPSRSFQGTRSERLSHASNLGR